MNTTYEKQYDDELEVPNYDTADYRHYSYIAYPDAIPTRYREYA